MLIFSFDHAKNFFEHSLLRNVSGWPFLKRELFLQQRDANRFLQHREQVAKLFLTALVKVLRHRMAVRAQENCGKELGVVRVRCFAAVHTPKRVAHPVALSILGVVGYSHASIQESSRSSEKTET